MSYDDPTLKELAGYFEAKEPGKRERADAWATAIGLQKVDGLSTSRFLVETAKAHIEGRITQTQARRRINSYYEAKDEVGKPDPEMEEPDKVSERIAAILNDGGFAFSPAYLKAIHRRLFRGLIRTAGSYRTVNIRKREWVLRDDSVTYAHHGDIETLLKSDFVTEEEFDYSSKTAKEMIPHFAAFISYLWQRHGFMEGNTRTVAVFAIKYLRQLGYAVTNNMFAENSWYFRNALVRANYMGLGKNAGRTLAFLIAFFRNLLLGEDNELKNRYLLIGIDREPPQFDEDAKRPKRNLLGSREKSREKTPPKSREKILSLLKGNPSLTQSALAERMGLSVKAIEKNIRQLKAEGRLRRVGPDKGGHWEVL